MSGNPGSGGAQTGQQAIAVTGEEPSRGDSPSRGRGKDLTLSVKSLQKNPPCVVVHTPSSPGPSSTLSPSTFSESQLSSPEPSPDPHRASESSPGDSFLLRSGVEVDTASLPAGYVGKRKHETEEEVGY